MLPIGDGCIIRIKMNSDAAAHAYLHGHWSSARSQYRIDLLPD
jgi:hypothetical protein